ncbi:MAG: alpha/beta fold hydrolase [Deltaproteobacteria bacterium]|nr:alpha/beta fold hydrolase [Deltaproteobacteria bacterium]
MKRKKSVFVLVCVLVCFIAASIFSLAQEERGSLDFKVLGDEAFQTILQFYQYDKDVPLDSVVVEKLETNEYIREKIAFKGAEDLWVPGYLALPKTANPPYPCVLQIHGMTLSKDDWWDDNSNHRGNLLTPKLLAEGIAVLALDYPYHGDRSILNDFESPVTMLFRQRRIYKFRSMVINGVIDYRRALDYLATREEIDSSRIGVIGSSIGGTMSLILTGVDSRIKATTACVAPALMHPIFSGQPDISAIAPYNFIRTYEGRPLLMLMGRKDDFNYTVEEAQALFDLVKGKQKELVFYDCGHRLPEEYIAEALDWYVAHLK